MSQPTIRRFTDMLGLLDRGRFAQARDEALAEALTTLEELPSEQGKATITVQVAIAYQNGRLDLTPSVKSKLPEGKGFGATPFWAYEGALSIQHPSQLDMFGGGKDGVTSLDRETA